uniref:Immunoglobulin C1-set domain-containing protein n=1 Tax=Marmota marmota marmota TaxID=9994 RepID=A0A8C5ZA87_MARMA
MLLWVLPQAWGSSDVLRRSVLFRCLQISSLANSSWMRTDALILLGELQTHSWSNASDTISFVKPWAQVKPEAWLSSGPSPGPGHLLLVCHVSGFYPKPVWVMQMRGEQEQQGTQRGDFLPNGDETWYLRATLDVAAGEAAGLACRVKHSSLGGQDLVLYWDGTHTSVGLVLLVVTCLVFLFMLILGLTFWIRKRSSYEDFL